MASGVLVWLFFFFFPRKKFALATPQGSRLLLPSPRPSAHTSWCRLQTSFLGEGCRFCKSQAHPPCRRSALCPLEPSVAKSRPPDLISPSPRLYGLLGPS